MAHSKQTVSNSQAPVLYRKILGYATLICMSFHLWLSFARHFFAPENNIFSSPSVTLLMRIDRWLALVLLVAGIIWAFTAASKGTPVRREMHSSFKRLICPEGILALCLFLYYLLCCLVQSGHYSNIFKYTDFFLFDAFISIFFFFPCAIFIGSQKARKAIEWMLHLTMLFSTAFIVWALWHLLKLEIVTLPNGLQLGMRSNYTFYPGVNPNIGAMIGTSMVLVALYMIFCHQTWIRLIYAIALIPHLLAILLTGCRSCFLALLVTFPLAAFMAVYTHLSRKPASSTISNKNTSHKRILISAAIALAVGIIFWAMRPGAFALFEAITHLGEKIEAAPNEENLLTDSGRLRIWCSALYVMFSSPETFFFGTPFSHISSTIKQAMADIYGDGSSFAHAHNMLLHTGLIVGVPGMLLMLAFWVRMVIRCVRTALHKSNKPAPEQYILPISILAIIIVNLFEPYLLFYISVMGCLFFLFCGWTTALDQEQATLAVTPLKNKQGKRT